MSWVEEYFLYPNVCIQCMRKTLFLGDFMSTTVSFTSLLNTLSFDPLFLQKYVDTVTDRSDNFVSRVRIVFKNGYALSVIRGEYACGGSEGLFEIALLNLEGKLDGSLLDEDDQGDTVLGYCTLDKVAHYAKKLALITNWGS